MIAPQQCPVCPSFQWDHKTILLVAWAIFSAIVTIAALALLGWISFRSAKDKTNVMMRLWSPWRRKGDGPLVEVQQSQPCTCRCDAAPPPEGSGNAQSVLIEEVTTVDEIEGSASRMIEP